MRYEVDVTIARPLDTRTEQFLEAARRSANRLIRFSGDANSINLTVEVAGIFPACDSEKYSEPRLSEG